MIVTEEAADAADADAHPADAEPYHRDTRSGAFASLTEPLFGRYWAALVLSMTGTWVRITAMGYLVYDLTGDPFKLGLISFAQAAPELIFGPVAGAYLDRVDRRKVLLGVQATYVAMMVLLTTLIVSGTVAYWHLLAIALIVGTAVAFDWPARLSIVPALVQRRHLQSAVALNAAAFNGSRVVGPTIGGWLIGGVGMAFAFGFTAVAALPFALVLLTMAAIRPQISTHDEPEGAWSSLVDGYRYIWHHRSLRALLSVDIIPIALGMSYSTMAPAIARDVLGMGSEGLGLLLTANGVGSLTGTLLVAFLSGVRLRGRIVVVGVAGFGALLIVFGLSGSLWLSIPTIVMLGLVYATYSTMNDTLIQTNVDNAYRGRVMAAYSMFWGLSPIGGLLAGFLATYVGVQWAVAINGVLVLVYVPYLWFGTPMRAID
jgi:MFS family permease